MQTPNPQSLEALLAAARKERQVFRIPVPVVEEIEEVEAAPAQTTEHALLIANPTFESAEEVRHRIDASAEEFEAIEAAPAPTEGE